MSIQIVEIAQPSAIDAVAVAQPSTVAIVEVRQGPAGTGGGGSVAWDDITGTASDVPFLPVAAPAHSEGLVFYDSTDKSLSYYNDEADVTMNIGREMWLRVRNNSGAAILNGKVVYINDAIGQLPTIRLARADDAITSRVIGIATHDIGNNEFGYVTTTGEVKGLDTNAFDDGDLLFLSAVTAGEMTLTAPLAPNRVIQVATVIHAHPTQGKLYCHPETDSIPSTGIVDSTATGRALITAASASAARTTLELGTAATENTGTTSGTIPLYGVSDELTAFSFATTEGAGFSAGGLTFPGTGFTGTLVIGSNTANRSATLPDASGTIALTSRTDGQPDKLTGGTIGGSTTFATGTTFTYGTGAASAHRTALGSGATGDALFTAASASAARTVLEINRTKVTQALDLPVLISTQPVYTDLSLTLTGGVDYLIRGVFDMVSGTQAAGQKLEMYTSQDVSEPFGTSSGVALGTRAAVASIDMIALVSLRRANFWTYTGAGLTRRVQFEIVIKLVSTGVISIAFAQAASGATASVFKAGSFLTAEIL